MALQTYQSVREQLVTLSVEIDDRVKVCMVLEEKVDNERAGLARLEDILKNEYTEHLESEFKSHKDDMEKMMTLASEGMSSKKDLLERCKCLVEQVKQNENEVMRELRKISHDVSAQFEIDKKSFRSGQEGRQRKFLASKLKEYEDSTLLALEPEFSRLRVTALQDMADVTAKLAEDTRRMKSDLRKLFENRLSSEEKHLRSEQRMEARVRLDEVVLEAEQLEREHKRKIAHTTEELSSTLDQFRRQLSDKVKQEREGNSAGLVECEKKYLDKMSSLRGRHEEDVIILQKEHSKKILKLRSAFEEKKQRYVEKHSNNASADSDEIDVLNDKSIIEQLKNELLKKRDSQLKAELRRLQTDGALAEKECRARAAEEGKRVKESLEIEEEQLRRKQNTYTNEIADLSSQKNELSNEIRIVLDELTDVQEEVSGVRTRFREAEGIQFKVKQKKKEIEEGHSDQMERLEITQRAKLQDLWNNINELNLSMSKSSKIHHMETQKLEADHEASLHELNSEIKIDINRKDEELDCLRDAVQTEKVKMDRIKKLLAKYI